MIYNCYDAEDRAIMRTADRMAAAARTAPKASGTDHLYCAIIDGEEKAKLADKAWEAQEHDADKAREELKDYDYVIVYRADDVFREMYGKCFAGGAEAIQEQRIYKMDKSSGLLE